MAIYTATQATSAVQTYSQQQAANLLADTIARYQYVFDSITASASTGGTQLVTKFSKYDYTQIAPVLIANGYAVTSLPSDDVSLSDTAVTYEVTITWASSTGALISTLTGVTPTTFTAIQTLAYSVSFLPVGGTSPYSFVISGALPTGMTATTSNSTVTIAGTPTALSSGVVQIIATDSVGVSKTTAVTWQVNQYVPLLPTTLSSFTNDAGYATVIEAQGFANAASGQVAALDSQLATVAKTGSYYNLTDRPNLSLKADVLDPVLVNAAIQGSSSIENVTFTGSVFGLTKANVGLDQVDNTADYDKPVSTATSLALDLKANIHSPAFTGQVTTQTVMSDVRAVLINTSIVNNVLTLGTLQSGTLSAGMVINGSGIPSPQTIAVTTAQATGGFATVTFYTQSKTPFAQGQEVTFTGLTGNASVLNGTRIVYDATASQVRFGSQETITLQATTGTVVSTQQVVLESQQLNGNWNLTPYHSGQTLNAPATTITASINPQQLATKDYVDRKFFFHLAGGIW